VRDPTSQLRSATRRAKSDVANKLISMCLHELSRRISEGWPIRVDGEEYEKLAREQFGNRCPYCSCELSATVAVIEHLDGMNRYRAGLHLPGNVLVSCKRCNGEKRRDDQSRNLLPGQSGWEAFLSHDGTRCVASCRTCRYWEAVWPDQGEREVRLRENLARVRAFRSSFPELERIFPELLKTLPDLLTRLYSDCQAFAEAEIKTLLGKLEGEHGSNGGRPKAE
jgi:hypothetical protein